MNRLDYNEVDPFDGGSWAVFCGLYPIVAFADVLELPEGHGHGCESLC